MVMSEQIGFSRVSPMETFAEDAIRRDFHADVLRDATDLSKQLVAPADSILCMPCMWGCPWPWRYPQIDGL